MSDVPIRTPEQMEWIKERFKPDGLGRLAVAHRGYLDDHGYYLGDVAALALHYHDALREIADTFEIDWHEAQCIAREAIDRE